MSTVGQNLDGQLDALRAAGCAKVFTDKVSGTSRERPGWTELLVYLRPGDTLVIAELSRMSRSLAHLLKVVAELEEREVELVSLREHIDTATATGRFFLSVMGAIAQMERELRSERASAGRAAARARGRSGGRPRTPPAKLEQARVLYDSGMTAAQAAAAVGVGRRTLFTYLAERRGREQAPSRAASAPTSSRSGSKRPRPSPRSSCEPDHRSASPSNSKGSPSVPDEARPRAYRVPLGDVRFARFDASEGGQRPRYWRNYVVRRLARGWEVVRFADEITGGDYGDLLREKRGEALGHVRTLHEARRMLAGEMSPRAFFADRKSKDNTPILARLGRAPAVYGWRHFTVSATEAGTWEVHAFWQEPERPLDVVRFFQEWGVPPSSTSAEVTHIASLSSLNEARANLVTLVLEEPPAALLNAGIDGRSFEELFSSSAETQRSDIVAR